MLIMFLAVLSAATAGGVYLTERVDRPRRRAERLANLPAE